MTRALSAAPIMALSFAVPLALATGLIGTSLIFSDTLSLWAGGILAGDGQLSIGRVVAAYPSIPFITTAILQMFVPAGTPVPALLSASILSLLAGLWFLGFRAVGLSIFVAALASLLLTFHPTLLRAAIGGPGEMLIALFMFFFGYALFDLRERCAAPDVIVVSLAMLGLAFSHPMGAAFSCAAVPFLVFAVRPVLVAISAYNVVVALIFPMVFAAGSFVYVSWIFPGSGWSFYSAPSATLAAWIAGVTDTIGAGLTGSPAIDAAILFAAAIFLGAPLAATTLFHIRARQPLFAPPLVVAAATVTAAGITVGTGLFGDPSAVAVAAPVLSAIVILRIAPAREHAGHMIALLVLGWIGGAASLGLVDPRAVWQLTNAHFEPTRERLDALNLGKALAKRNGVLVDTDNSPAVVVGRESGRGLLSPSSHEFTVSTLFSHLGAPYIAIPNPHSITGTQDLLVRHFPSLYRNGSPGYRLIYQNNTWRLYARNRGN